MIQSGKQGPGKQERSFRTRADLYDAHSPMANVTQAPKNTRKIETKPLPAEAREQKGPLVSRRRSRSVKATHTPGL